MMTIYSLTSANDASKYYEQDNYYAKDDPESIKATHWWGKGAEHLGLSGYVSPERFKELLEGIIDQNTELGRKRKDGGVKHKPGYDLTFSAPKSVSMLAEIAGDKRIYEAHDRAVNAALSYIQKVASQTRKTSANITEIDKTDNLTVAKFRHDTSRGVTDEEGQHIIDCQLHTHAVVLNMVLSDDGVWRSLSEKRMYELFKVGGAIYRSKLFEILRNECNYDTEKTRDDGLAEIAGFQRHHIEAFSNRTMDINKLKAEKGVEGYIAGKTITIITREGKVVIDRDKLITDWKKRADDAGIPLAEIFHKSLYSEKPRQRINIREAAQTSLDYAINHLSERKAVFDFSEVLKETLWHGIDKVSVEMAIDVIEDYIKDKRLVKVGDLGGELIFTSPANLAKEQAVVTMMKEGQGVHDAIAKSETVELFISSLLEKAETNNTPPLTKDQQDAIRMVLTNTDQIFAIQGYAGVGKTTMLQHVVDFAKTSGYSIKGLATTGTAARTLAEEINIDCQTLSGLIFNIKKLEVTEGKPELLIVDETSMASTDQMFKLQNIANKYNKRILYTGDRLQFHSVEAGDPFGNLQDSGMKTVEVKEIVRQKDERQRMAVQRAIAGDIEAAFEKLQGNIVEKDDKDKRINYVVNKYLSMGEEKRAKTIIAVLTHKDRAEINAKLRNELAPEGSDKQEIMTRTLQDRGFTWAQKGHIANYEVGNVIRFSKTYRSLNVKKNDYFKIVSIDDDSDILTLQKGNQTIKWRPGGLGKSRQHAVEVFESEDKPIRPGEFIRFTRSNKPQDILNSDTGRVKSLKGTKAVISLSIGKEVELDISQPKSQHWDYAWSSTMFAAQGKTADYVISLIESVNHHLTHLRSFYVLISRARYKSYMVVDSIKDVTNKILRHSGENEHALDYLATFHVQQNFTESIANAYDKLQGRLVQIDNHHGRLDRIAGHYTALSKIQRAKTVVIVPDYKDRLTTNKLIRDQLMHSNEISKDGIQVQCLERQFVNNLEKAKEYRVGDIIRFNASPRKLGFAPGEYVQIIDTKTRANSLMVRSANGEERIVNLKNLFVNKSTDIELYQKNQHILAEGDRIRWTRTNKALKLSKDREATVEAINDNCVMVKLHSGERGKLSLADPSFQHFEYAYTYRLTNKFPEKFDRVVANLDHRLDMPSKQANLFSLIGQARKESYLYTHNAEFATTKLNLHTGRDSSIFSVQEQMGIRDEVLSKLEAYQHSHQALGKAWKTFFEHQKGKSPLQEEQHNKLRVLQEAHHELAYEILSSDYLPNKIIDAYNVNLEKIHYFASKHQAKLTIDQYVKSTDTTEKQKLSQEILKNFQPHKEYVFANNIKTAELVEHAWRFHRAHSYNELPQEGKQHFEDVAKYITASHKARVQWQAIIADKNNNKEVSQARYNEAKKNSFARDQIASELINKQEIVAAFIQENISKDFDLFVSIKTHSEKYDLYKKANDYLAAFTGEADVEARQLKAKEIISNFSDYKHYLKEHDIFVSDLSHLNWDSLKIALAQQLNGDDRKLIGTVDTYFSASKEAREKWATIFDMKQKGEKPTSTQTNAAYSATRERNASAYQLQQSENETIFNCLDERAKSLITKHANIHIEKAENEVRYQSALSTEDWRHSLEFEEEMRQKHIEESVQTKVDMVGKPSKPFWDKETVIQAVLNDPERVLSAILQQDKNARLSKGNLLVYGSKGSVKFNTSGTKAGLVSDFERDIRGDIIHYYSTLTGKDWYSSIGDIADIVNLNPERAAAINFQPSPEQLQRREQAEQKEAQMARRKRETAQKIWREGVPIKDTLAETYLRSHRSIKSGLDKLDVRYNPKAIDYKCGKSVHRPALVVAVKDSNNHVKSVQCIYLNKEGNKDKTLDVPKRTFGASDGLAASIYKGGGKEIIIAEGPETAASLISAKPEANIYISLGRAGTMANFGYLAEKHKTDKVLIAADNDDADKKSVTWDAITKSAIALAREGLDVSVAKPNMLGAHETFFEHNAAKTDFNDILVEMGEASIAENIKPNFKVIHENSNDSGDFSLKEVHRSTGDPIRTQPTIKDIEYGDENQRIEETKIEPSTVVSNHKKIRDEVSL